jgi:hypothetical protein
MPMEAIDVGTELAVFVFWSLFVRRFGSGLRWLDLPIAIFCGNPLW